VKRTEAGFTLVEITIAVAIGMILAAGVYAALVTTERTSELLASDASKEAARMRAAELLKTDLRGRMSLKAEPGPQGGITITLSTTADSLSLGETVRMLDEVRYVASEMGLRRSEGKKLELVLATEPVAVQFWEKGAWRPATAGDPTAFRVLFGESREPVVIR